MRPISQKDRERFKHWFSEFAATSDPENTGIDDAFDAVFDYATLYERRSAFNKVRSVVIVSVLIVLLSLISILSNAQLVDHTATLRHHVDNFCKQAGISTPAVNLYIAALGQPASNGRIDNMPDGTYRIVIDKGFYEYFQHTGAVENIIYRLMSARFLSHKIQREKVYRPLKDRERSALTTRKPVRQTNR